jgi:hypothetical protein
MSDFSEKRFQFRLTAFSKNTLITKACQFHNQRARIKAAQLQDLYAEVEYISSNAHPRVLERLCVNYLHHVCETQYPLIAELRGNPEQYEQYAQIKAQLLEAITQRHPWLANECQRQALI